MRCGIIGAGLAGLSCADGLAGAGYEVELFDKGRGPGGRMSTRRLQTRFGEAHIDHGAPCFQVSDPSFAVAVAQWEKKGLVAPWKSGPPGAWIGMPRMSAIVGAMAVGHTVHWNTFVGGILRNAQGLWSIATDRGLFGPFDILVTAVPAEQAVPILALYDLDMARDAARSTARPCWVGLFVFENDIPVPSAVIRNVGMMAYAVSNRAKPGRTGPEAWIVHANPEWSQAHIEDMPTNVAPALLTAFRNALNLQSLPSWEGVAHRWRYATADGLGRGALWNSVLNLGACGDWLLGPDAEAAWRSGRTLCRLVETAHSWPTPRLAATY